MRKVLFGTGNPTRLAFVKESLSELDLEIISLSDININKRIQETKINELEIAKEKALGYFRLAKMPTFSIDSGLYIDSFPQLKQPGPYVRRIDGIQAQITDDQMLEYYVKELSKYGGESDATWRIAIAIVLSEHEVYTTTYDRRTKFTAKISPIRTKGEPLNSIQINPNNGKYEAEMSPAERKTHQIGMCRHIEEFVKMYMQ